MPDRKAYPVLVVDDDPDVVTTFRLAFDDEFTVLGATSGTEALAAVDRDRPGVLVCDQRMPDMHGVEVIQRALALAPDLVPIVLTGFTDYQALVRAMNVGRIFRYVPKPWDPDGLREVLHLAVEQVHVVRENARLAAELAAAHERLEREVGFFRARDRPTAGLAELVGNSPAMARIRRLVGVVKDETTTVLVTGPTGTGKELVARGIHFEGVRCDQPFLPINCAALPEGLIESELFGYRKGSHDKAFRDTPGLFEVASGGTLFLDEIGVTTPAFQAKLLRVLETSEVLPIGARRPVRIDTRVVVATSRDLATEIERGAFLPDLYYRLRVFPIAAPPLVERREDIPALVTHFLGLHAARYRKPVPRLDPSAMAELLAHDYPGNVRELSHLIERAVLLAVPGEPIVTEDLFDRPAISTGREGEVPDGSRCGLGDAMARHERGLVVEALERNAWSRRRAAAELGVSNRWLLQLMKKHGLGNGEQA